MEMKFKLTRWDYFYSNLIAAFQQLYLIVVVALMLIYVGYVNWVATSEYNIFVRLVTTFLMCIPPIFAFLVLFFLYLAVLTFSKNNETFFAEQNWKVTGEQLVYETEYGRSEMRAKALKKVSVVGGYVFLYFSQIGACIVPKRAFESDRDWMQFIQLCRSILHKK